MPVSGPPCGNRGAAGAERTAARHRSSARSVTNSDCPGNHQSMMKLRPTALSRVALAACKETKSGLRRPRPRPFRPARRSVSPASAFSMWRRGPAHRRPAAAAGTARFVADSLLEGTGFELSVPRRRPASTPAAAKKGIEHDLAAPAVGTTVRRNSCGASREARSSYRGTERFKRLFEMRPGRCKTAHSENIRLIITGTGTPFGLALNHPTASEHQ
jgi:hypothetical protein